MVSAQKSFLFAQDMGNIQKLSEDKTRASPRTQKLVGIVENLFDTFCIEKYDGRTGVYIFEELRRFDTEKRNEAIADMLQLFVDWNYTRGMTTVTVKNYLSQIKKILIHQKIRFDNYYLKGSLQFKFDLKDELHALQMKEIQRILQYASPKNLSFYYALLSTGCRPGELLQVRVKDITFDHERPRIKIRNTTTKTKTGRSVWLTEESTEFLKEKLRGKTEFDYVWGTGKLSANVSNHAVRFKETLKRAGMFERYDSVNRAKISLYSFRSFFFNICADVHREGYAHRMLGHAGYLPQYDRMSDEKRLDWFLAMEDRLTVDKNKQLRALTKGKSSIDKVLIENNELSKKVDRLESELFALLKRNQK